MRKVRRLPDITILGKKFGHTLAISDTGKYYALIVDKFNQGLPLNTWMWLYLRWNGVKYKVLNFKQVKNEH